MIETRRLKNVVIFIQTILSFVLSRKTFLLIWHKAIIISRDTMNRSNWSKLLI